MLESAASLTKFDVQQFRSMKKPAWLVLATQTKARIDRLSKRKTFFKRRCEIVHSSHDTARDKYNYPGTLLDWDYVVDAVANGKQK